MSHCILLQMIDLQSYKAKICYTAAGHLIVDGKIMLIKHKKLQSWMSPGGHIDENELPHQAAEREFFEETGLKVKAISSQELDLDFGEAEVLPYPLMVHLHWVSKENYEQRIENESFNKTQDKNLKIKDLEGIGPWKKGCEQHLGFVYLMEPAGELNFYQNIEETDGIGWFSLDELSALEIFDNVRKEIALAFNTI